MVQPGWVDPSPLVGRELDLAAALEQLKRVEGGTPAALLVRGEAGLGKTRLVGELADRARQLGYAVLVGRADDLDHGIPYAVFRDLVARAGIGTLPFGGDVTEVFAAAVDTLREVATGPTVLVLEDLHVADRDSLVLAALLVRLADVPVLSVLTVRPSSSAADLERVVEQLADDGRGTVLDLEPLDRHDTQALVAAVLGAAPDDPLIDAVVRASSGNPFFARESAQSLLDGGAVAIVDDRARLVPDAPATGLRPSTAVLRRLFVGAREDIDLAKALAVFGRFPLHHLPLVERLLDRDAAAIGAAFDRLVASGVLVRTDAGYDFSHPIVRDTLYEDIGPAERRRLHAAIAAALGSGGLDLLELATHVAASAEPGDVQAANVLLEAGRAVAASAPLVSADYHRRAVELLPADSPQRGEALAAQTRALHVGARSSEASAAGLAALAVLPDGATRHAIAALVAGDLYLDGRSDDALAVITAELDRGAPACPLLALRSNILLQAERYDEAHAAFPDAVASLATDAPAAAQLLAIAHLVQYANHVGENATAVELLGRLDAVGRAGSQTVAMAAHELVAYADWRCGLVRRVEDHLASARALRADAMALSIGGGTEGTVARVLWLQGRWDDALHLLRATSTDLVARGTAPMAHLLLAPVVEILIDRGDVDAAAALAEQLQTPIMSNIRHANLARARLARALGDPTQARALLECELERAARPHASIWKVAEVRRELVELDLEEGRDPAAHVDALDALAMQTGWLECEGNALRARALVHRDPDAGRAYAAFAEREGWVVEQAHAALLLGTLDVEPGTNLPAAYRLFDGMGAAPWRRRAAAALRERGLTVPRRAAQATSTLTETEQQLVRLVRDGLSNRQIATAMSYSPKTIEVYLSRLYAKTGFASRLELIRAVDAGALAVD